MLDDARFVEHYGIDALRIELVEPVVVGDVDTVTYLAILAAHPHAQADRFALARCLLSNSERSEYQHSIACMPRPLELHAGFAESGICKQGSAPTLERPSDEVSLKWEQ